MEIAQSYAERGVRVIAQATKQGKAAALNAGAALATGELLIFADARQRWADDALTLVGLQDRANHFPAQLSGGEQQRVAIARAIAKNPEVLLCDEPTGALDSATGIKVLEALTQVNRAVGATTLVITHNAAIRDIADRVIRFADGRIIEETVNATKKQPSEVAW